MKILWLGWEDLYATRRMKDAAREQGVHLEALEIFDIAFISDRQRTGIFHGEIDLLAAYDALVIRTFYPYISEALTIARLFRDAGKVVIDQSLTDEGYAVSKEHDYILLAQHGLPIPATRQVFDPAEAEAFAREVGYPCILKGIHGAHGSTVFLVHNPEQLRHWLLRFPAGELAVQEFLPAEQDYRVMTVGYRALPVIISRKPARGDFRTNFAVNARFSSRPLDSLPELGELSEQASRLLRREFSGVDIRFKGDRPMILEVNRRPAFEGFEKATGFDVAGAFLKYILSRIPA
jgi:gamma-F420-2:alpha-L-glutamate ligase